MSDNKKNNNKTKFSYKDLVALTAFAVIVCFLADFIGDYTTTNTAQEHDDPYTNYYFDYAANKTVDRPTKVDFRDMLNNNYQQRAESFKQCKALCADKNLISEKYFHEYDGKCSCIDAYSKQNKPTFSKLYTITNKLKSLVR